MDLKTNELKENITHLKEKNELLQSELASHALKYERTLVDVDKLKVENEQLKSKLAALDVNKLKVENELQAKLATQGDVDKFRVENEQLKFKLATLDVDKLKVAVDDCDDGLAETDHCAGDNKEANAEMKLVLEEFTITNKKLTDQITDLKNQLAQERSKTCEHEILLGKTENLKSDLIAKDDELCRIKMEFDEAKQQSKRDIAAKDEGLCRIQKELDEAKQQRKREIGNV
ncbi:CAP-Gly domain-containing linker protein 1-like [Pecten maximus]|uniref:CAP-Gly domain-containing linker protein 1-like n=1 Tax=Pecten maximus TaxID=6579 RepID=UPI0014585177|nr:CAP-Gly domain-containing linker protein 1-like [Pecten maximus]